MCESRATLIWVSSLWWRAFFWELMPSYPSLPVLSSWRSRGTPDVLLHIGRSVSKKVMRPCRYQRGAWITLSGVMNKRLIPCFSIFMLSWGFFWGKWWCLLEFNCRFSQTSLSLLANNFISKRNAVFISSSSFAPFLDSCPFRGWEGKFLGAEWNKVKFFLVGGSGSCNHERESSYQ